MNEFNKITVGWVIQKYKTLSNGSAVCVDQKFYAGDQIEYKALLRESQVEYETVDGEPIEVDTDKEVYCPFLMVQPKQLPDEEISISWHFEDVKSRAKERHFNITDQQAKEILQAMKKGHDCSFDITWDVIDAHLDMLGE